MSQRHLLDLKGFVGNMRRIDVVTADGSFDCQGNPDEQEALVSSLHYLRGCGRTLPSGPRRLVCTEDVHSVRALLRLPALPVKLLLPLRQRLQTGHQQSREL